MRPNKIAWENWDPDVLDEEIVEETLNSEDFQDDEELVNEALSFLGKIPKLITTPSGIFQLHDKMNILNQFDCWMGHCNFDITKAVEKTMESIDGVEFLSVIGRYRFFLGIGRLFNFSDVRREIEKALCNNTISEITPSIEASYTSLFNSIGNLKTLVSEYKHWAIFIGSDGMVDYTTTNEDNDQDYLDMITEYEKYKKENGGTILQNET